MCVSLQSFLLCSHSNLVSGVFLLFTKSQLDPNSCIWRLKKWASCNSSPVTLVNIYALIQLAFTKSLESQLMVQGCKVKQYLGAILVTPGTSALQFAWARLHSGPRSASYSCYQLQVCLPGLGSLTASRMFGHWRQIRRLSTHLTEDFITLQCVSECVCACVSVWW